MAAVSNSKVVESYDDIMSTYDPTKNTTRNVLTRYEKAKIIGMRLEQVARGSKPYVDVKALKLTNIRDIVIKELEDRKLPFMICRTLPNGQKEYYRIQDMIV